MEIWHDTEDAPRRPHRVSPGQRVELVIGTWPIGPEQAVSVTWTASSTAGEITTGATQARWRHNGEVNSYWSAEIGPFSNGDRVTYSVEGASSEGTVRTADATFTVKPALYIAWLWHQHQPLYRDPGVPSATGSYRAPWVRLHAIRDYYSMAAMVAEHDVHVTINLTPVLLRQIDDYLLEGATDAALDLTRSPSESLSRPQVEALLANFFDADWHHEIFVHPRYGELFEQRTTGQRFSRQDLRDLQMWFNLAWFGHEFRAASVCLCTGETVDVARFVQQGRGFSHADVLAMVDEQFKIMRAIVPIHRSLQDAGHIEISTTPWGHPILPLLIDTDQAPIDRPGASWPARFAYPEDAASHLDLAQDDYARRFGRKPVGLWPAEGSVSSEAVSLVADRGFGWLATDAGVLARSGRWGYRADDPGLLCQPYRTVAERQPVAVFFRDTDLSDGAGFRHGRHQDPQAAVDEFLPAVETKIVHGLTGDEDQILTIVLDGENAWGGYPDDGRPFLRALYRRLDADPRLRTVTFSEYLEGNPARGISSHALATLAPVHELATGSWIDEPGSAPGVDLGTWIGEPEENAAWALLGAARTSLAQAERGTPGVERARASLLAAEGSDWFWWFGGDQESHNDASFDELFRAHVRGAYEALGLDVPEQVDEAIVPHPMVWTFAHPISRIGRRDSLTIRTNCPGRLTYQTTPGHEHTVVLTAVGGVMAGARRFQATLGPFPRDVGAVTFTFHCEHPGCPGNAPCCLGLSHQVKVGRAMREAT